MWSLFVKIERLLFSGYVLYHKVVLIFRALLINASALDSFRSMTFLDFFFQYFFFVFPYYEVSHTCEKHLTNGWFIFCSLRCKEKVDLLLHHFTSLQN